MWKPSETVCGMIFIKAVWSKSFFSTAHTLSHEKEKKGTNQLITKNDIKSHQGYFGRIIIVVE